MSILTVGSVAYDHVITPFDQRERSLGGAATFFALAAAHFTDINLVAVVGEDFALADRELLQNHGVDLKGLEQVPGRCFFWKGEYKPNWNDRITHDTQLNVFEHFNPKVPEAYRSSDLLFLANIHPSLQLEVLNQVERPKVVALDTMNLWIDITRKELLDVLAKVDILLINDSEAEMLTGKRNLVEAAAELKKMGPHTLCLKQGEHGAMLMRDEQVFAVPAYPFCTVVDPTGAGDCFAGGFLGYLDKNPSTDFANLKKAMVYGSVMGSYAVEGFSVDSVVAASKEAIEARYRKFVEITHFDS